MKFNLVEISSKKQAKGVLPILGAAMLMNVPASSVRYRKPM